MHIIKIAGYNRIYAVDVFDKEYRALFGKNLKDYAVCSTKLNANLEILDSSTIEEALSYQQIEKLKNCSGLYAIRYKSKLNPRVILAINFDSNIILLTAFKEKSKSDYNNAIARANERMCAIDEFYKC